ncbi:arylacetamide deacetylase-like 4 [Varanus komodoensis]|uniref:arylacetamide deacetylase-like 4 n=1 Tax=Varanus komodoensis TaxID=61221 RepID=UPI001CF7D18C|nr:arylacetamide deacetylase-like 4 [Varanus komodoensis]
MAVEQMLWLLALYMGICVVSWLLLWAICYNLTRTYIPAEISQRAKLGCANLILGFFTALGLFLEKVGICHRYRIWRVVINGVPPLKDSSLIIEDLLFDNVPVRVYRLKASPAGNKRGMLYLHGGVGLIGSIQAYERVARHIARESGTVVVSVGFRLAPEHQYPASLIDCQIAAIHFLKNAEDYGVDPNRIIIGGDSSGATFAAATCQYLVARNDLPKVRAQILLSPFLQAVDFNLPSYQQNHSIPPLFKKRAIKLGFLYLTGKFVDLDGIMKNAHVPEELKEKYGKWISADYIPDEFKIRGYVPLVPAPFSEKLYEICKEALDPMFSPLLAEESTISQQPEAFILTCEYDVVRDDGLLYKKRLEDNGVPVTWLHIKDGFHGMTFGIDYGLMEFPSTPKIFQHLLNFLKDM